ncbi:hypothetical protein A2U01_0063721, partial [Trifolium medium]|nr:hypothetical protein [Trifolium medium]
CSAICSDVDVLMLHHLLDVVVAVVILYHVFSVTMHVLKRSVIL